MKYAVTEVTFKQALACVGGSAWMATVKQGGFEAAEFDAATGMLALIPGKARPGLKKRRVHVSNTLDIVYGVTIAASKAGGSSSDS